MSVNPVGATSFSVIIPTRDRPDELTRCLHSVIEQSRRPAQVVIVDDGAMDCAPLRKMVEQAGVEWTYLKKDRLDRNRSRNLGVEASKHSIVAFLDDDVVLDQGYFAELIGVLEQFSKVGVVGTTARVRGQRPPAARRWARRVAERVFLIRGKRLGGVLRNGFCTDIEEDDEVGIEPFDVDFCAGGACAYFREICRRRPFPEGYAFLASGDDKMFGLRITRRWRTLFVPRATALHLSASSARPSPFSQGRRKVLCAYWVHRQFARRRPLDFLLFLWGGIGSVCVSGSVAAASRQKRHLQFAGGLASGLGRAMAFQLTRSSLRKAVERAAARRGERIDNPVGLGEPVLVDPQEPPPGGFVPISGAGQGER